jgi:hypothetical protein
MYSSNHTPGYACSGNTLEDEELFLSSQISTLDIEEEKDCSKPL